jgi:hypothetical protein
VYKYKVEMYLGVQSRWSDIGEFNQTHNKGGRLQVERKGGNIIGID